MLGIDENPLVPLVSGRTPRFSSGKECRKRETWRKGELTSSPRAATVRARVYPGNSSHCPMLAPSPRFARSREACRRVLPVASTTGEAIWFDMANGCKHTSYVTKHGESSCDLTIREAPRNAKPNSRGVHVAPSRTSGRYCPSTTGSEPGPASGGHPEAG